MPWSSPSPHALHFEHVRDALQRGLPVLTDKPVAVTAVEVEELRDLAIQHRLPLLVAFGPPYSPAWRYFRTQIARGAIGPVQLAQHYGAANVDSFGLFGRGTFPADFPAVVPPTAFRASAALGGGGYLQDVGSHSLGGILIVTGLRPVEVSSTMDSPPALAEQGSCHPLGPACPLGPRETGEPETTPCFHALTRRTWRTMGRLETDSLVVHAWCPVQSVAGTGNGQYRKE